MTISNEFVFLHYPKTGSAFVRKIFLELMNSEEKYFTESKESNLEVTGKLSMQIYEAPNIRALGRKQNNSEHGIRVQIPEQYKQKPIYSVRRNILRQLVSLYEYGHWRISHEHLRTDIKVKYPKYPELTFEEFLLMRCEFSNFKSHPWIKNYPHTLGPSSIMFVLFYAKEPFILLNNWDDTAFKTFKNDLSNINFLQTRTLNQDLISMLSKYGFDENIVSSIREKEKINQSKPENKSYSSYYTPSTIATVKQTEPLFFDLYGSEEHSL